MGLSTGSLNTATPTFSIQQTSNTASIIMSLDKSKIIIIQSHDWGGQLFLMRNNKLQLVGYTTLESVKERFMNDVNSSPFTFAQHLFAMVPVSPDLPGAYYLTSCIPSFNPSGPEYPLEPVPPAALPVVRQPVFPPLPDLSLPGAAAIHDALLAKYNKDMLAYEKYLASKAKRDSDIANAYYNYMEATNRFQTYASEHAPVYDPAWVLLSKANGLIFEPYTAGTAYDTYWYLVNIPNINNMPWVFLLKMAKPAPGDTDKYLTLTKIPNEVNVEAPVSLTETISSHAQLWDLRPLNNN